MCVFGGGGGGRGGGEREKGGEGSISESGGVTILDCESVLLENSTIITFSTFNIKSEL